MIDPLEQRRKEAMRRYLKGEKVSEICRALSCSTSFLYRWRHRFNRANNQDGWEKAQSRQPEQSPFKTPDTVCQEIVRLKKQWSGNGQSSCAIRFIQQALSAQGIDPVPSRRTIYRILSRHENEENQPASMS